MGNKTKVIMQPLITIAKILIILTPFVFAGNYFNAVFQAQEGFTLIKSFMQLCMMVWVGRLVAAVFK